MLLLFLLLALAIILIVWLRWYLKLRPPKALKGDLQNRLVLLGLLFIAVLSVCTFLVYMISLSGHF